MLNVLYFVFGFAALAVAFGWLPSLDAVRAIATGAWAGAKGLVAGPWAFSKLDTLGLVVVVYVRRLLALVGVFLLVLSLTVGGVVATSGLSPRDALDSAIRGFQSSVGLTADGVFGPATVKAYYGKR